MGLGIPYSMIGIKFFERKEVKDILSFIRAALNRDSWSDIGRVINLPARGIGEATLEKLRQGQMEKFPRNSKKGWCIFLHFLIELLKKQNCFCFRNNQICFKR